MKPILTIPSDTVTKKELDALQESGYIVIVTDEPDKVKFHHPKEPEEKFMGITKDILLEKALYVIYNSGESSGYTIREWFSRIIAHQMLDVKKTKNE